MLPAVIMTLIGFVVLMIGAEFTVKGSVALANKLNVPAMIIGLTVVAFGTSLPEFAVSVRAVMEEAGGLVLGTVVGANIANVLLILGFTAMVSPFRCNVAAISRDYKFLMFVVILFMLLAWSGEITQSEGLFLLFLLFIYIVYNYRNAKLQDSDFDDSGSEQIRSWFTIIIFGIIGVMGIRYGSDWLIEGAVAIAEECEVSHEIIGLTLIAFGTSLPELATSVMASLRGHADVAIGNIIGSNIMNILLVTGFAATSDGLEIPPQFLSFDMWVMFMASASILPVIYRSHRVSRLDGLTYFFGYVVYMLVQGLIASGNVNI